MRQYAAGRNLACGGQHDTRAWIYALVQHSGIHATTRGDALHSLREGALGGCRATWASSYEGGCDEMLCLSLIRLADNPLHPPDKADFVACNCGSRGSPVLVLNAIY